MLGTVHTIHPTYFFIRTTESGEAVDWFAHHLTLRDGLTMTDLHIGMQVQFVPERNAPKGPRAVLVAKENTDPIETALG